MPAESNAAIKLLRKTNKADDSEADDMNADWVLNNTSTTDNLMPAQLTPNLQCF
jgi:hypothetical protein